MKVLVWMFTGFDKPTTSEHLLTAIIEKLCQNGHSVHIIQKNCGGNRPAIPECLIQYSITTDQIPFDTVDKGNLAARYLAELQYIYACKKYIRSDLDAVFIQSTTVGGAAVGLIRSRLKHAIITFNVQDIFPYNAVYSGSIKKNGLIFWVMAMEQRYAYKHSDHIITISEDMKNLLVEDGTEADKIEVIHNWSYQDESYFFSEFDLKPVSNMFRKEFFNVVYAGNIGVMQNVDILIETAKLMKEDRSVWFHIIGNGLYKEKLIERAKDYGLTNISFWPMQPAELAPVIYSAADVNVIPLVKNVYKTALPSKTATCLACQKPIVFAIGKEGCFSKKIMQETGCFVVESDNAEELMKRIIDSKNTNSRTMKFFKKYFSRENADLYSQIIVREGR